MEKRGKESEFEKWTLAKKFRVSIKFDEEDEQYIGAVEEYLMDVFGRNVFFTEERQALVATLYQVAMDYYRLKHRFEMEKVRIQRLTNEIKKLRENL